MRNVLIYFIRFCFDVKCLIFLVETFFILKKKTFKCFKSEEDK